MNTRAQKRSKQERLQGEAKLNVPKSRDLGEVLYEELERYYSLNIKFKCETELAKTNKPVV